jgi:hypothetical protein
MNLRNKAVPFSVTVAHLGNIAFKTGKKLQWNTDTQEFVDDGDASKLSHGRRASPGT